MTAPARGGGGEGGEGGGGGGGGGGGEGGQLSRTLVPPSTDSPNPLEEAKLHRRYPGAHLWVHTKGPPPPPPTMVTLGWGSVGRGLRGGE